MAKRMIHYKSVEWYKIKFQRSIVTSLIILILTLTPLSLMLQRNFSVILLIVSICVFVFLAGYFFIAVKTNHVAWKEAQAEERAKRKKVHRRAPVRSQSEDKE